MKTKAIEHVSVTYTNSGKRCLDKIEARFIHERRELIAGAMNDTTQFRALVVKSKQAIDEHVKFRKIFLKSLSSGVNRRAGAYDHVESSLRTLHSQLLYSRDVDQ